MRHHWADFLDRDGDYWTISENRARHQQGIEGIDAGDERIEVATIGKVSDDWENVHSFPNLVELTLHEPSNQQIEALAGLGQLERLRITHARPKQLDVLAQMPNVRELVLEYISGTNDLSPVGRMPKLRSLYLENLRRVSDFSGLADSRSLRFLSVRGTVDWKQPMDDFAFVDGLPDLEVIALWQVKCRAAYPALLPVARLRKLKSIRVHRSYLPTDELALLEEGLQGVDGADWGPWEEFAYSYVPMPKSDPRAKLSREELMAKHPEVRLGSRKHEIPNPDDTWFVFSGTGAGRAKVGSKTAPARCEEFARRYATLRAQARELLGSP